MKGIAAVFFVAVISAITGCAATRPTAPVTPAETEYVWADYHDGREPTPAPPVAKNDAPAPTEKLETKDAKSDETAPTKLAADIDDEPAPLPKPVKRKKAKGHRKAAQAGATPDAALAKKKPRKRKRRPVDAS